MEAAEYDLIVVGAGPAGSACAITAARAGSKVLLLEKDRFPRHKVCGEFVSPESLRLLDWLLQRASFRDKPEITSSRVFSGGKIITLPISPCARSIPRYDLDLALLEAAQDSGVRAAEGMNVREVDHQAAFRVKTTGASFAARAVVNATGRWSQLTQHPPQGEKWIGVKAHFREDNPPRSVDLYFFDGGYCGVQPVGRNAVNACAMVRSDAARSLDEVFPRQSDLYRRSRDWKPLFPAITTSPLYFRRPQTESRGMLLAGDSASFIDPFAGDGISLAMHSGTLAAQSLQPFLSGKTSLAHAHDEYRKSYMKYFAPVFRNAARVRMALSAPTLIRSMLLSLAATPRISRIIVKGTRVRFPNPETGP